MQAQQYKINEETAKIDGGMSISQIREEIKICERIKREEINRIYRLKAELEKAQRVISTMKHEIKEFNDEIKSIELQENNNR